MSRAPLPTFVVIGAQKSATRWLRVNLGAHPDIYTAPAEIRYFSSKERFARGIDWYREQFPDWQGEPIVGEATPAYMMWRHRPEVVAGRIHDALGSVRLLAILRNPVDRAASALLHHVQEHRLEPEADLLELIDQRAPEEDPLGLVSGGWYAASLRPFQQRFGDALLVLLQDDLAEDAGGVYEAALHHVGAEPTFVPPALDQVRFSYREKLQQSSGGSSDDRELSAEARGRLYEFFRDDVEELQDMIGRDLSMWDPATGRVS